MNCISVKLLLKKKRQKTQQKQSSTLLAFYLICPLTPSLTSSPVMFLLSHPPKLASVRSVPQTRQVRPASEPLYLLFSLLRTFPCTPDMSMAGSLTSFRSMETLDSQEGFSDYPKIALSHCLWVSSIPLPFVIFLYVTYHHLIPYRFSCLFFVCLPLLE